MIESRNRRATLAFWIQMGKPALNVFDVSKFLLFECPHALREIVDN